MIIKKWIIDHIAAEFNIKNLLFRLDERSRIKHMDNKSELILSPYFENTSGLTNSITVSSYVREYGCKWGLCLQVRVSHIEEFLNAIKKGATKFYRADPAVEEFEAHFIGVIKDRLIISVTKGHNNYACSILSNLSLDHIYEFVHEYEKYFLSRNIGEIDVDYFYYSTSKGFVSNKLYIEKQRLQPIYPELYPDININTLLKDYRASRESILILYGEAGVGKTTFIKHLIAAGEFFSVAYVKDPKVMTMGDMWGQLTNESYDLVIFDDLDTGLAPRQNNEDKDESNFMTQLLSFSDGIFHANKTKIIITTNQHIGEIDGALIRAGRCFDFLQLNPLSREQALAAWTGILKLDAARFNEVFKSDEIITQASLMSEAERHNTSIRRGYIKSGQNDYTIDQKLAALNIKVSTNGQENKGGSGFRK